MMNRVMVALWVSLDNFDHGTGASESSLCTSLAWLGPWSSLPNSSRSSDLLFLQSPVYIVLEHHAEQGQRQLRFRDMARDILGESSLEIHDVYMSLFLRIFVYLFC